ncbi:group II intron maturase-specific domain-containing protein [Streptosporangium canum]|uniref:group II intron maturase-specific domain-containing protein n=1 Tax=Streptosporangium canum TaxID=324952 RepID=UPI00343C330A
MSPRLPEVPEPIGWHAQTLTARFQRHRKRGTSQHYVYTYPARTAVKAVTDKVKPQCRRTGPELPLDALFIQLNRMLRGWCAYVRPGVSAATFK